MQCCTCDYPSYINDIMMLKKFRMRHFFCDGNSIESNSVLYLAFVNSFSSFLFSYTLWNCASACRSFSNDLEALCLQTNHAQQGYLCH